LLKDNPHARADKRSRVQRMFGAIAGSYDLNNRLHSFGRDQAWRRKTVKLAELKATDVVVDVACGTGDLTLAFAREMDRLQALSDVYVGLVETHLPGRKEQMNYKYSDESAFVHQVIGVDFTYAMLPLADKKARDAERKARIADRPSAALFINGDAQSLPLPDACCDVVSIAFGIRNVQDPAVAIAEFYRILRPGGRLLILEFSKPRNRLIRFFNDLYCQRIMPHTATWISGDKSGAYKYLPMSVDTFIDRDQMSKLIESTGFTGVSQHPFTFGVCVCYRGRKPA
jgi:demethylmenaquinone methyltransferase / 2-methoxy-6-polyprenyl-1,4-benzoquinol methylase